MVEEEEKKAKKVEVKPAGEVPGTRKVEKFEIQKDKSEVQLDKSKKKKKDDE